MSKIICDVCGTTYAETATRCPICGSARTSVEQTGADSGTDNAYTYVRGGRFSKGNVRKRNRTGEEPARQSAPAPTRQSAPAPAPARNQQENPRRRQPEKQEEEAVDVNKGLIVVVVILLLAIIAVTAFIVVKFMTPGSGGKDTTPGVSDTQPSETDPLRVPCTSLTLSNSTIEFTQEGNGWLLNAEKQPLDSTDEILFSSSDESVVTVSESGYITAVGGGEAVITATCGDMTAQCTVVCSFTSAGATDPTDPPEPTNPVDPNFVFEFNTKWKDEDTGKYDTTIDAAGKTWRAYKTGMTVDPTDILWTVDDPAICTVEDGIVTAVAPGKTEVHATYGGKTYSCIVRCSWEAEEDPTEPEDGEEPAFLFNTTFKDKASGKFDVSLEGVGQTWRAYKPTMTAKLEDVVWTVEDTSIITIENGVVTAVALGQTELHAEYDGVVYTCIVRVV